MFKNMQDFSNTQKLIPIKINESTVVYKTGANSLSIIIERQRNLKYRFKRGRIYQRDIQNIRSKTN